MENQLTEKSANVSFTPEALSSPAGFLAEIRRVAQEAAKAEGCCLYDLEFVGQGGHRALRVYIEKEAENEAEKEGQEKEGEATGISIDDCSHVSRRISEILEANEDAIPGGAYDLEVSSPGLERTLREPWHFQKAIGKKISVKSSDALLQFNQEVPELGLAKQIQGRLVAVDESGLRIEFSSPSKAKVATDEAAPVVFVPLDSVTKAHVVFEFEDPAAPRPGSKPGKGAREKRGSN